MVALSYASNAIFSKARAMYGKRLKENDYAKLLACSTVPEVLSCLKSNEKYAPLLNKLSEKDIHRGQLEEVLRQQLFQDYESLCRYEITVGEDFSKYTLMKAEIGQIINFLVLFNGGNPHEFYSSLPKFFSKVSSINLAALSNVTNYDEFLNVLGKSVYAKLLAPFRPKRGDVVNLSDVENVLYNYMFKTVYEIIDKTSGAERKALRKIFDTNIDLRNFTRIFRLKKYYKLEPDEIRKQLLPFGSLKERQIEALCNAQDTKELFSLMQQTSAGKKISKLEYSFTCEIPQQALYEECYKCMYFSVNPSVVLVAYYALAETETDNIIHIIEGVRYGVEPEKVKSLLIYK